LNAKALKNILVVDDEKHIRLVFMKILSLTLPGCKVDIAVNGAEAVDAFSEGRHDLLVMDLHMPVKDGFSAFREIQGICEKEHIKMPAVIFCTGYDPPKELTEIVAKTPLHCILQKPVAPEVLSQEIKARL